MLLNNRWTWGRQLYWGIILFLLFWWLNVFIYDASNTTKAIVNVVLALVALLVAFRGLKSFKLINTKLLFTRNLGIWGILAVAIFIIIMSVENVPLNIITVINSKNFLLDTMIALSAAIFEESICRGLILSAFLGLFIYESSSYKFTKAAVWSAVLFGSMHLINLFGESPRATLQQMLYAFATGVFLAALRITTNCLLWVILLHFILDWGPLIAASNNSVGMSWSLLFVLFTPLLVTSLIYLIYVDRQLSLKET
ncbi:CPBP family intramembrane glutamic endopeptidase [Liquorilactobacillus satsumensis]|uniref:CPBP family intramembrane glutamic endopeptidase n=1 Tax=Liquorilactobacillus satsumensis TaxID=259059 RepID=UPI0021C3F1E4|nr:CPBP family intramembrane glutamic endopeptidase [Liquorilactobacillus satsumensis]MCP9327916.1 CPBP family intramembrane metalloprotease [Liquorilactobacillus satsumensis]